MPNNHLNLGNLQGPLLIFGGPYSNLQATQAMIRVAQAHNIPPQQCICTGDIVAYCAQPQETVALIQEWGAYCLMGNCEESFANNSHDCGCGFEEGSHCDLLSVQWFQFASQALSQDQRDWFSKLPRTIEFTLGNSSVQVVHGSVSSINEFIFPSSPESVFDTQCALSQADVIIGGHSGIPFTKTHGTTTWHNAGAIGMPANDGTPRTWFSIIDTHKEGLDIQIHSLDYDYPKAQQAMVKAGMDNAYAQALATGLWPSVDILPMPEREAGGKPLGF